MVGMLPDLRDNSARISALNVQMTKLEERADELHDHGIKALYLAHRTADPMAYIVGAEIYDHLEGRGPAGRHSQPHRRRRHRADVSGRRLWTPASRSSSS